MFIIIIIFLTLQYCIGFAIHQHISAMGIHMFPILNPPLAPWMVEDWKMRWGRRVLVFQKSESPKLQVHGARGTVWGRGSDPVWGPTQFSSVTQSCLTLYNPMDCSTPGLPGYHQLLEFTQTHVHWVVNAIQPPHRLLSPSPPAFNLSQLQGLFKWVSSLHQVAKVVEFQLQHQSFQWIFRTELH